MAHFFKPPSPQVVNSFRIPLGETWDLALWGVDTPIGTIKPKVKDEDIAVAIESVFPPRDSIAKFVLRPLRQGATKIEGLNARGQPWAEAEIIVVPPLEPAATPGGPDQEFLDPGTDYSVFPSYIDKVKAGRYDIDADRFTVDHEDGTTVELPYRRILAGVKAAAGAATPPRTVVGLAGYVRDRKTMKIHPLTYNKATTPNLAAMVLETEEAIQNAESFIKISGSFLEIIKVYLEVAAAAPGLRPSWKAVPKRAPGAPRPRLPPNVIQGEPPAVKIGGYGEPGNLIARVESGGDGVVYRVESIILQGEGKAADVALARAAHREMIVRAAQQAQKLGQRTFRFRGIQANANFRAHADRLAQVVGVPGSGKVVGGIPGAHSDYEVILDVAKVLAGL